MVRPLRIGGSRLSDRESWWRVVNGKLVLDIQRAHAYLSGKRATIGGSAQYWVDFAEASASGDSDSQGLFWRAHQVSLHAGVNRASNSVPGYLSKEGGIEIDVITVALTNVDLAATLGRDSRNPLLGRGVSFVYPSNYPASEPELVWMRTGSVLGLGLTPGWLDAPWSPPYSGPGPWRDL